MTIEERRAEILRKRLLNQRLANAKFSDYQTPMGGPRRRGRGGLLNSTLGALSSVVSNDDNDLDNVSFSTNDGMKVNLQNNRAKDSTPKNKLADFSWYRGNYGGGNEDIVEQQTDIHPRISAMNKHRERLKLEQEDRNRENAMRSDAIGAFIEKNSAAPELSPRAAAMQKHRDELEAKRFEPVSGNEDASFDAAGYDNFIMGDDGTFPDYFPGMANEDAAFDEGFQYPMEPMDDGTFPGLEALNDEALLGNEDPTYDANGYLQDWRVPLMDDWTGDGEFDYTGVPLNPDNQILGEESAAFDEGFQHPMEPMDDGPFDYPSTLDTSYPYVPNDDYTNEWDELTEDEQLAIGELEAAQEWRDNNPELAEEYDAEILASQKLADEKADEEWVAANPELAALEEELTMESNMATRHPEEDLFAGDNLQLDKDSLIFDEMVTEIADTKDAFMQLNKVDPKITEEVTNIATELEETGDQEKAEFKLSGIFDWLKDIFGVDDKSLLRAFVKYVGGRLFGLSSGKAAAFAWKGIEQDMATEAAKGADAREYEGNMAEYDRQYKAAMKAKNYPLAEQILRKMNDYSGIDKTDPEKYYEGLEYLQDKLADAKKTNVKGSNDELIKGIQAQLDKWIQQGVTSGTKPETWMGSLTMEDADGISVVKQAMQVEGQPLKYWNSKEGKWKLPKEDGYTNAIRTVSSDRSTEFGAMDKREYLPEEEELNYERNIPNAKFVTNYGVPMFEEATAEVAHSASQAKNSVKSLMQMMDMIKDPRVRLEVFDLTEKFYEDMGKKADEGPIRAMLSTYISQKGSPIAKIWFNNLGTLITGKLRRETGAAYNKEELVNTLKFFPDASLMPADYLELPKHERDKYDAGIEARMNAAMLWILTDSEGLQAYPYMEGLMMGDFKPDDLWIQTNNSNRKVIELSYPSEDLENFMKGSGTCSIDPTTNNSETLCSAAGGVWTPSGT